MSPNKKQNTTDAEIDRAIRQGKAHDDTAAKIDAARYDAQHDALAVRLSTGAELTVPRSALPLLSALPGEALGEPTVEPPGYSVWFEQPGVGVRIETLLEAAVGSLIRDVAARALGSSKSAAKAKAVRANGVKGGRPRKNPHAA